MNYPLKIFSRRTAISLLMLINIPSWAQNSQASKAHDAHAAHSKSNSTMKTGQIPLKYFDPLKGKIQTLPSIKSPKIVEIKEGETFELRAEVVKQKIGKKTFRRFAYNGSIPGPIIKVKQGSNIKIKFINNTDVETSVHSHGLRLNYLFDGSVGISQPAVQPGQTFVYELKFPDAGIYWYHPHVREDYQQDMGLMGNFIVEPKAGSHWSKVTTEDTIMLDDMLVENPIPYPVSAANHAMMGRYGDTYLVNGKFLPTLNYSKGEIRRYFLTNAANTRTFRIKIKNATMKVVGSDISPFEKEFMADSITIAPGERYVIEVKFDKSAIPSLWNSNPQSETKIAVFKEAKLSQSKTIKLAKIKSENITSDDFKELRSNQSLESEINSFIEKTKNAPPRNLKITVDLDAQNSKNRANKNSTDSNLLHQDNTSQTASSHLEHDTNSTALKNIENAVSDLNDIPWISSKTEIEWEDGMRAANERSTSDNVTWKLIDDSGNENMQIQWKFKKDVGEKIVINNSKSSTHPMQHPIHFHGQRFIVYKVNDKLMENHVWKDTFLIGAGDKVEILIDASNVGKWMAHCHISEHLTSGMMIGFDVLE